MKKPYPNILGANPSKRLACCLMMGMGLLGFAMARAETLSTGIVMRAYYHLLPGEPMNRLMLEVEIENRTDQEVVLPKRGIGPIPSFRENGKSAEFMFWLSQKSRDGGGSFVDSVSDFSPVSLRPGKILQIETSTDVLKEWPLELVKVTYQTKASVAQRYGFTAVKLECEAVKR